MKMIVFVKMICVTLTVIAMLDKHVIEMKIVIQERCVIQTQEYVLLNRQGYAKALVSVNQVNFVIRENVKYHNPVHYHRQALLHKILVHQVNFVFSKIRNAGTSHV